MKKSEAVGQMTGKPDRRHCEKLNDRRLTQLQRQISGGGICSDLVVFHPLSSTNQSEVWGGIISPCPRSCTASETPSNAQAGPS